MGLNKQTRKIRAFANIYKQRGDKRRWHQLVFVLKNANLFTWEQLQTIINEQSERLKPDTSDTKS
jgi:hypothetical protein